jgi:hypothetical protein
MRGYSRRRSARSLCGWPPRARPAKTIRTYTDAVQWFAAARLRGQASWEQVGSQDIQRWMAWLLDRYSSAYASNQYRALQQFFKWLAAEDQLPDPMAGCSRRASVARRACRARSASAAIVHIGGSVSVLPWLTGCSSMRHPAAEATTSGLTPD